MTRRFRFSKNAASYRRQTTYEAMHEGQTIRFNSMLVDSPTAWMRIVKTNEGWRAQVVRPSKEDWGPISSIGAIWIECRRIG